MMRSPVDMFADLEAGLRDLAELRRMIIARQVEPEAVDAAADQMSDAVCRVCKTYGELEQHANALEDLRDVLQFTYGGEPQT